MNEFLAIPEADLAPTPAFYVEQPDGRKDWPEIDRQATFFRLMRFAAPRVMVEANPLAGKRNPRLAKKEGVRAGKFDVTCRFEHPLIAWIEFKGFDSRGRPGKLSTAQIEFGNRVTQLGYPAACFFSPHRAVEWVRSLGFPVAEVRS